MESATRLYATNHRPTTVESVASMYCTRNKDLCGVVKAIAMWVFSVLMPLFAAAAFLTAWLKDRTVEVLPDSLDNVHGLKEDPSSAKRNTREEQRTDSGRETPEMIRRDLLQHTTDKVLETAQTLVVPVRSPLERAQSRLQQALSLASGAYIAAKATWQGLSQSPLVLAASLLSMEAHVFGSRYSDRKQRVIKLIEESLQGRPFSDVIRHINTLGSDFSESAGVLDEEMSIETFVHRCGDSDFRTSLASVAENILEDTQDGGERSGMYRRSSQDSSTTTSSSDESEGLQSRNPHPHRRGGTGVEAGHVPRMVDQFEGDRGSTSSDTSDEEFRGLGLSPSIGSGAESEVFASSFSVDGIKTGIAAYKAMEQEKKEEIDVILRSVLTSLTLPEAEVLDRLVAQHPLVLVALLLLIEEEIDYTSAQNSIRSLIQQSLVRQGPGEEINTAWSTMLEGLSQRVQTASFVADHSELGGESPLVTVPSDLSIDQFVEQYVGAAFRSQYQPLARALLQEDELRDEGQDREPNSGCWTQ